MTSEERLARITARPRAVVCEAEDCRTTELLSLVELDDVDDHRVLCPKHQVLWLREEADR